MKCFRCGNVIDKIKFYSIKDKDGNVIGVTCRFCGYNHIKKNKPKLNEPQVEVLDVDEYQ